MRPRDRYHRAMDHGGSFSQGYWQDLVDKAVAAEKLHDDAFYGDSSRFSAASETATWGHMQMHRGEFVRLEPGMMVVRGRDILGAEAEIARAQIELDELRELAEQDINDARRSRMLNLLDAVRRKIATRGEV